MKYVLLTALLLTVFLFSARAQGGGKLSGKISAADKEAPLTGATVALLKAADSAAVKFTVSAKDGSFLFEDLAAGKYLLSVTSVGYRKAFSKPVELTEAQPSVQLPAIALAPVPKSMADVTVTARRPPVEHKIDRTVVNVEASVTNAGATALEVLEKAPGVSVDKDGNISLKGKEGVIVMVDGRPTQLGGTDLANLLRNMNAASLDQIEIMTNPPARYDAAGNAGIINIRTKKTRTAGYNGSVNLNYTQGRYPKVSEGFIFNYRQGKVNVFTNLSHNYNQGFGTLTLQRRLRQDGSDEIENYFDQRSDLIRLNRSYNARAGIDFFATKKTTFGVVFNGFNSNNDSRNTSRTDIATATKELESVTLARVDNDSRWKSFGLNGFFRTVFDSAGRELTADLDYANYSARTDLEMANAYYDAYGSAFGKADTLLGLLPQDIRLHSGRVDYLHPLKKGARFEAGLKSSVVETDNNVAYDSIQNGMLVHDFRRSNHFRYRENINAAYVNLSRPLGKKLSAQLGLRMEHTNASGKQLTTGQSFERHYVQLFPTAYFQYKKDKNHNFGLNYGRRIRRPNYESLNPFIRFLDRYTYTQGNPDLRPELSHNIELSHSYRNQLTTTLNYGAVNDIMQSVIEQKGQEAYQTRANIASMRQYGIAFSANMPVTKWWTNSLNINIFRNHFEGVVNGAPISLGATRMMVSSTQQFKLTKTLTGEVSGFYRTAGVQGVLKQLPVGMLAAGLSQQVLKNKGVIRLTVRDLLNTQRFRAETRYGNVDMAFQERGDNRVIGLGFSYRFSKGKAGSAKKRTDGSAGEEQNRIGID